MMKLRRQMILRVLIMAERILLQGIDSHRRSLPQQLRDLANDLEIVEQCFEKIEPKVAINDWAVVDRSVPCLVGRTIGHPTIADYHAACTSELFYLDEERGVARTMSRWYRLGSPMPPDFWSDSLRGVQ